MKKLGQVLLIERALMVPDPDQPRQHFDPTQMKDLAASMRAAGQQTPVTLRHMPPGSSHPYKIIDGERRWRAAAMINLTHLKAWVRDDVGSDDGAYVASVVSNFARADHTPLEIAVMIARLRKQPRIAKLSLTDQAATIASILGRSMAWVYQYEMLLKVDPAVVELMSTSRPLSERLSPLLAPMLVAFEPTLQRKYAAEIIAQRMPLRQARIFLDAQAHGRNLRVGSRNRNYPQRRHERFVSSLSVIVREAEDILTMPHPLFREMVLSRPQGDRQMALARIDAAMEHLKELRQAMLPMLKAPIQGPLKSHVRTS